MNRYIGLFKAMTPVMLGIAALSSCEDSPNIGSSLIEDKTDVVKYSEFTVTGHSVGSPSVETRNLVQMLGRIDALGYGKMTAEFVTQLMPSSQLASDLTVENVDSVKLQLYIRNGAYVGDSVAPMGLEIFKLNRQLPAAISSDFDAGNYYSPSDLLASKIYTCNALGASDSVQNLSYRMIDIKFEKGVASSLARELITLYQTNPDAYLFPSIFAKEFPGLYVRNSYGNGRIVEIEQTMLTMYYHTTSVNDEGEEEIVRHSGSYFSVTPEIILNNILTYDMSAELQRMIDNGDQVIVAPIGRDVELEFPVRDVIDYYRANSGSLAVVNTLSFQIPAEVIENDYGIEPPESMLMVLSADKEEFFNSNGLADNVMSFYTAYNPSKKCYTFAGMREYLIEMLKKGDLTPDDYTFTLTPVTVVSETNVTNPYYGTSTEYISSIDPYIGAPTMVKLDLGKAEISLTFSKQTVD